MQFKPGVAIHLLSAHHSKEMQGELKLVKGYVSNKEEDQNLELILYL